MSDTVELAHESPFAIGRVKVLPSQRELVRDDGEREVLEHRVMQVLIALAKAQGGIVTRDELTASCWQGRVVGEDAINRVMSRLRKAAEGIGAGSFRIETVTKIGYRLNGGEVAEGSAVEPKADRSWATRRAVAGGLAAAAVAGAGAAWLLLKPSKSRASPEIEAMMEQGRNMLLQDTREGGNQAIGLYRRVTVLAPDYADGWGALGMAYGRTAAWRTVPDGEAMRARAIAAAKRALALDPDNAFGRAALAGAAPLRGNWARVERSLRQLLAEHPRSTSIRGYLAWLMEQVGRNIDAAVLTQEIHLDRAPPSIWYQRILQLWAVDRLDEADATIAQAAELYPTQFSLWFERYYILMYTGRAREAIPLAENPELRPTGIPEDEFAAIVAVAKAIESRAAPDIDRVMARQMARARLGNGYAENTIQFASAMGRLDDAFAVADAYYFGRGFVVPDLRFTVEQGTYMPPGDRATRFLFWPSTRAMRAEPRFARLVDEIGLERYWRETGTQPDYRRS